MAYRKLSNEVDVRECHAIADMVKADRLNLTDSDQRRRHT